MLTNDYFVIVLESTIGFYWTAWSKNSGKLGTKTSFSFNNKPGKLEKFDYVLHLPKDIINWSMNSITAKVVIRFKTRPYEVIKNLLFQQPFNQWDIDDDIDFEWI